MIGSTWPRVWLLLGQLHTGALWGDSKIHRLYSLRRHCGLRQLIDSWHQYDCFSWFLPAWPHYPLTSLVDYFICLFIQYILKKGRKVKKPKKGKAIRALFNCLLSIQVHWLFKYWIIFCCYNTPTLWVKDFSSPYHSDNLTRTTRPPYEL